MIRELECVVLKCDIPEYGLTSGDIGTVVLIHRSRAGAEVEFATLEGESIAVITLPFDKIRPINKREIAHARALKFIPA